MCKSGRSARAPLVRLRLLDEHFEGLHLHLLVHARLEWHGHLDVLQAESVPHVQAPGTPFVFDDFFADVAPAPVLAGGAGLAGAAYVQSLNINATNTARIEKAGVLRQQMHDGRPQPANSRRLQYKETGKKQVEPVSLTLDWAKGSLNAAVKLLTKDADANGSRAAILDRAGSVLDRRATRCETHF